MAIIRIWRRARSSVSHFIDLRIRDRESGGGEAGVLAAGGDGRGREGRTLEEPRQCMASGWEPFPSFVRYDPPPLL